MAKLFANIRDPDQMLYSAASGLRSAMRAASQLPGRGPTDVDVAPGPAS